MQHQSLEILAGQLVCFNGPSSYIYQVCPFVRHFKGHYLLTILIYLQKNIDKCVSSQMGNNVANPMYGIDIQPKGLMCFTHLQKMVQDVGIIHPK